MAFVDWPDNAAMADTAPAVYWPKMADRIDPQRMRRQQYWHALPVGWEQHAYEAFLAKRRTLLAQVIRDGFARLWSHSPTSSPGKYAHVDVATLIAAGESATVELKSSARWNFKGNTADPKLEHVIVKTIAGFMNADGGTLLIGMADDGKVLGLDADYATLGQKGDRDGYELVPQSARRGQPRPCPADARAHIVRHHQRARRLPFGHPPKRTAGLLPASGGLPAFRWQSAPSSGYARLTRPVSSSATTWSATSATIGDRRR